MPNLLFGSLLVYHIFRVLQSRCISIARGRVAHFNVKLFVSKKLKPFTHLKIFVTKSKKIQVQFFFTIDFIDTSSTASEMSVNLR